MPTTAAIAGGLGAAGSLGSAWIGANAAQNASAQQVAMQEQALALQKNALNPFITAGQSVLPTLQGLITPGANQNKLLTQTPGFQFAQQYGTMAATNALAAKTGPSAGPLATAISEYNSGLAQNTWQGDVTNLQNFAGLGENAGVALAGAAGTTLTNTGNALASGTLGSAAALSGGLTGAAGSASNALLLSQLFGGKNSGIYGTAGSGGGGQ